MKQNLTDPYLHPCISNRHTNNKLRFDTDLAGVSKLKYNCLTHSKPLHGRKGDRRQGFTQGSQGCVWNRLYCSQTLFTEAGSISPTHSSSVWLAWLASLLWGLPSSAFRCWNYRPPAVLLQFLHSLDIQTPGPHIVWATTEPPPQSSMIIWYLWTNRNSLPA